MISLLERERAGLDAFYFTRADFILDAAANIFIFPLGNDFFSPKLAARTGS